MNNPVTDIDEWFMLRWTKFTASEIYKLLIGNGTQMFGAGAMTYIKTKALEMSTFLQERPELEEVKSLLWGKVYEYPAYEWYINETKNYSMRYLGTNTPLFLDYEAITNESGGSPDVISLTSSDTIDNGSEIKCPKNSMYHYDRLKWRSQWDLKEGYIQCYSQIQHLMLITGATSWDFVSFDDRQRQKSKKGKIIQVKPDKKFQDNLHLRILMAVKEKYKNYDEHMNS